MGNFAQHVHPLTDAVTLKVQRVNSTTNDTFTVRPILKTLLSAPDHLRICRYRTVLDLDLRQRILPTPSRIDKTTAWQRILRMDSTSTNNPS